MKGVLVFGLALSLGLASSWKQPSLPLQNQDALLLPLPEAPKDSSYELEPFFLPEYLRQDYLQNNPFTKPLEEPLIPQVLPQPLPMPKEHTPPPIYEKDFIIAYKFLTKDEVPQGEKYSISEPLTPLKPSMKLEYQCQIDVAVGDDIEMPEVLDILLKDLLGHYKEEVLDCLYKSGVKIEADSLVVDNKTKNKTLLSILPTRTRASLQNGFLILKVFKEQK